MITITLGFLIQQRLESRGQVCFQFWDEILQANQRAGYCISTM
jgi:hypothetical protein